MKLKELLVRIFDYNRNNKTDWYEFLFGTIFMILYVGVIIGFVILIQYLIDKIGLYL